MELFITKANDDFLVCTPRATELFSDHFAIELQYLIDHKRCDYDIVSYRKLNKINIDEFKKDIALLQTCKFDDDLDIIVERYNATLRTALDEHARSLPNA